MKYATQTMKMSLNFFLFKKSVFSFRQSKWQNNGSACCKLYERSDIVGLATTSFLNIPQSSSATESEHKERLYSPLAFLLPKANKKTANLTQIKLLYPWFNVCATC